MAALSVGDLENVFAEVNEKVNYASAIVPPRVNDSSFKIDGSIYTMLKLEGQFCNSTDDDPYQHLENFFEVGNLQKKNNISNDTTRLRVFKYSLDSGCFMDKTFNRISIILHKIEKHNHVWHGGDRGVGKIAKHAIVASPKRKKVKSTWVKQYLCVIKSRKWVRKSCPKDGLPSM
ncbi:hypothetical protein HAX54_026426 [Datura stramonium]|uniref:Uncharacterized protein n=1 Tax=Datura stramonium TaxID=4076 RepID=A0ABS8S7U4_DATST|nr:hypothetical protein [Datura stramonium]